MKSQSFQKIPLYIIIAVIIFILIFVVILASIGSSEKTTVKASYYKKDIDVTKSNNKINIVSYTHNKVSDSFVVDIENPSPNQSYIFGGPMQFSTVSVYKYSEDELEKYDLVSSKVFSGNQGFAVCSNLNLVNPSYYQIGKKIELESIRYNFIPFNSDKYTRIRIVVNNIGYEDFKVYKCSFNYDIPYKSISNFPKSLSIFGLSEYDIEKSCMDKYQELSTTETRLKRVTLNRTFNKKDKSSKRGVWNYNNIGNFIVFYVKGIYSFNIKDSYNNINILENGNKDLNNGSLEYFIIKDPRLTIENLDENIPNKSFNDDMISLMNAPVSFYKHFLYGKKKEKVDIWNRIQNKIFVYKIE